MSLVSFPFFGFECSSSCQASSSWVNTWWCVFLFNAPVRGWHSGNSMIQKHTEVIWKSKIWSCIVMIVMSLGKDVVIGLNDPNKSEQIWWCELVTLHFSNQDRNKTRLVSSTHHLYPRFIHMWIMTICCSTTMNHFSLEDSRCAQQTLICTKKILKCTASCSQSTMKPNNYHTRLVSIVL